MLNTVTTETATIELVVPVGLGEVVPQVDPVAEGREAWVRIKSSAKMMREDWRKVGEALLVGRKANRSDKKFGQWCKANGFDDMDRRVRTDAMWLVENWATVRVSVSSPDACNPQHIRAAYNKDKGSPKDTEPKSLPVPGTGAVSPQASGENLPWEGESSFDQTGNPDTLPSNLDPQGDGGNMGIFDGDQSEIQKVRSAVGDLVKIQADKSGELFYTDFLKQSHPDYFVGRAVRKLHEELRSHTDTKTAVQRAAEEIRRAEEEMLQAISQRLEFIGNEAMKSFINQIDNNPLLASDDQRVAKLLTRALDEGSEPSERMVAITALKKMV